MFKAFLRGTDIQNPQLEVHGSFPPCKVIFSKTHLTLATWETGPATPWCLEPAYERAWMFKFRKWKLVMQGLTIRYMLQNVCQIRCKYESHAILLFCFMAPRGIFSMHDRHWSGDLFRCLHNSIIWYNSASYFHFCVELFVFRYQLSVSMGQKSRVKFWNCWVFLAVIGRFMLSLDLMNFRKSGARVQKLLPDKEEEECVFSIAFSS